MTDKTPNLINEELENTYLNDISARIMSCTNIGQVRNLVQNIHDNGKTAGREEQARKIFAELEENIEIAFLTTKKKFGVG